MGWTPEQLGDLAESTYLITGGNSGLGLEAAKLLSSKGAKVVITTRSATKGRKAVEEIRSATSGEVDYILLDLTDPQSIADAAQMVASKCSRLDAVINNAGVMQTPELRTAEGFELQLATNHLGHFRLNSALFRSLDPERGRIVVVSSFGHRLGKIHFEDLMLERRYDPLVAYCQSKLANLMYALELHRRLRARGSHIASVACHPGYANTNLQSAGVGMQGGSRLFRSLYKVTKVLSQTARQGAYPLVLAAADPDAESGAYYGPRFAELSGPVGKAAIAKRARDEVAARRLWERTEELVGPFFKD